MLTLVSVSVLNCSILKIIIIKFQKFSAFFSENLLPASAATSRRGSVFERKIEIFDGRCQNPARA